MTKTKAPACKVIDSKPRLKITYKNLDNGSRFKIDRRTEFAEKFEKRSPRIKVPVNKQKKDVIHDDLEWTSRNQIRKIISMAKRISSAPEK